MTPDRYEVAPPGRRRLNGAIQKRGSKMGMSTVGGLLFGSIFVLTGTAVILLGTKVIKVNSASVNWPYWVLTVFGLSFALAGLWVWSMVWRQFAANRRRAEATRRFPGEPALADYPWHPDGFDVSEWPALAKSVATAMFVTIFLSMFNWWAFGAKGPAMVKIIVVIFDCFLLVAWGQTVRQLGRALKFGHSRIEFTTFPCRLGKPVVVRWQPFRGINHVNKGTFTLRCLQEWMESQVPGGIERGHRSRASLERAMAGGAARNLQLQERVELRYELPADALPTQFGADKPVFWELEVKLDLPGLDLELANLPRAGACRLT